MVLTWKGVPFKEYDLRCRACYSRLCYEKRCNKYCDHRCAASYTNTHRKLSPRVRKFTNRCIVCNTGIDPRTKHCAACRKRNMYNLDSAKTAVKRKRILLMRRGHRCECCKLTEWNGRPIPLDMDHVNGNSDINTEENLRLLCPNCHAQTPTYKSKNRGVGSKRQLSRMQKYRDSLLV